MNKFLYVILFLFVTNLNYSEDNNVKRLKAILKSSSIHDINANISLLNAHFEEKEENLKEFYDIIIVGSGIHATIALFTIKSYDPTLSVLVVSAESIPGGNYSQTGSSYFLNSPEYTTQSSNYLLNCPFQILDIAPPGYATGLDLANVLKFNLSLHHGILTSHKIVDIHIDHTNRNTLYRLHTDKGLTLSSRAVIVATGLPLDRPSYGISDKQSLSLINETPMIEHYAHFCKRLTKDSSILQQYAGKKIAVVGGGGGAGTLIEAFDGLGPSYVQKINKIGSAGGAASVDWYIGPKYSSVEAFDHAFKGRFTNSIVQQKSVINLKNNHVEKLALTDDKKRVRLFAKEKFADFDHVIFATGYESDIPIKQIVTECDGTVKTDPVLQKFPIQANNKYIANTLEEFDSQAIIVGPAAAISIPQIELDQALGSSTTSIELFGERTVQAVINLIRKLKPFTKTELNKQFSSLHKKEFNQEKEDNAIRILTWNVKKFKDIEGNDQLDAIVDDISKIKANVIALQEAYQNCEIQGNKRVEISHDWENKLKSRYKIVKGYPKSPETELRQQALALLTDLEIQEESCLIFPKELQQEGWGVTQFGFQAVKLKTSHGPIEVINVHLTPASPDGKKRKAQLEIIRDFVEQNVNSDTPVYIVGDFNSINYSQVKKNGQLNVILEQDIERKHSTPLYELDVLYQSNFQEVFDGDKAPWVTTWAMRRVDYIFSKNNKFAQKPFLLFTVRSDHLPVGVDLIPKEI